MLNTSQILLISVFSLVGCSPRFPPMRGADGNCVNVSGRYLLESVASLDKSAPMTKYPRCKFLDILFDHGMSDSANCLLPPIMELRQQACEKLEYWWVSDSSKIKGGEVEITQSTSGWLEADVQARRRSWCVATFRSCRTTTGEIRIGKAESGELVLWERVSAEGGFLSDRLVGLCLIFRKSWLHSSSDASAISLLSPPGSLLTSATRPDAPLLSFAPQTQPVQVPV